MHHERLVARAVLADILEFEALRQVEVELHRGKLPEAPDRVDELDVDLRPVERGLAGDGAVRNVDLLQALLERVLRHRPLRVRADEALAVVWIPGRELDLE